MAGQLLGEWFWVDRWKSSLAFHLPMEAKGLLRCMLSEAWICGGRLPGNARSIRIAIGCDTDEWERSWPLVQKFWRETEDGFLVNDEQLADLRKSMDSHDKRVEAGKKGASARWQTDGNANSKANGKRRSKTMASGSGSDCKSDASHPPVPAAAATGEPKLSTNPAVAAFQDAYAVRYGSLPAINSFEAFGKGLAKAQAAKKDDVDGVRRAAGAFLACTEEFVAGKAHPWSEFVRQYDRWHEVARKEQLREQRRREIAEAAAVEQQTLKGVDFDPDRVKKMRQLVLAQSKEVGA